MQRFCALGLVLSALGANAGGTSEVSDNPRLSVIAPAPQFKLLDTRGRTVRLSDYRGQAVILAFIFTTCPGVCPLISHQMAVLQSSLKAEGLFPGKARLISVTVDPKTDTAAVLADYARSYGADAAGWSFLRETPERLRPVLESYQEWTKRVPKLWIDHPARIYLLDPNGNIREIYSLAFFNEKQALIDIRVLLSERTRAAR